MLISEMSQILSVAPQRVNNSIDTDTLYGYSESLLIISDSTTSKKEVVQPVNNESSGGLKGVFSIVLISFLGILIIGGFIYN